jgi:putative sigma-54 modulation protein
MKFNGNFTEAMKDYTAEKLEKLTKYLDVSDAVCKYKKEGNDFKVEISLGDNIRAAKKGDDFYHVVIEVVDVLASNIKKYRKSRAYQERHCGISEDVEVQEFVKSGIVREKIHVIEETTEDIAISKMELLGHTFYIYKDIDRGGDTCVVYKRTEGDYGLIVTR